MYRSLIRSVALLCVAGLLAAGCQVQPPSGAVSIDPNLPAMHGTPWLWTSSTGIETIPDPSKYTITFSTDGTFDAQVDCNRVAGQFTVTETNEVEITPGPST